MKNTITSYQPEQAFSFKNDKGEEVWMFPGWITLDNGKTGKWFATEASFWNPSLVNLELEYEEEQKTDKKTGQPYTKFKKPGKGFGGKGGYSKEKMQYEQERMDRRTALMQAVEVEKDDWGKCTMLGEKFYQFLRKTEGQITTPEKPGYTSPGFDNNNNAPQTAAPLPNQTPAWDDNTDAPW